MRRPPEFRAALVLGATLMFGIGLGLSVGAILVSTGAGSWLLMTEGLAFMLAGAILLYWALHEP